MDYKTIFLLTLLLGKAFGGDDNTFENGDQIKDTNIAIDSIQKIKDDRIDKMAEKDLEVNKRLLNTIAKLKFDKKALEYFDNVHLIQKYINHKKRIYAIKKATRNEWDELGNINEDLCQIISYLKSYRMVCALKNKAIPAIKFESLKDFDVNIIQKIEDGDTLFENDVELFYAFFNMVGVIGNTDDSLFFRAKYQKNLPLYIFFLHLNLERISNESKIEPLKYFLKMNENDLKICLQWDRYYNPVTRYILNGVINEYIDCINLQDSVENVKCLDSYFTKYPKEVLSFLYSQLNKFNDCTMLLDKISCEYFKKMIGKDE